MQVAPARQCRSSRGARVAPGRPTLLVCLLPALAVVGCQHFTPVVPGGFSTAEFAARQEQIEALLPVVTALEAKYQRDHQVDGVTFVAVKQSPGTALRYATDADNAIFTGMMLAAASYRYGTRRSPEDLVAVESALEGVHLLTHVSGIPGVLARWAFPLANAWEQIGYDRLASVEVGNWWAGILEQGQLYEHGGYGFHTRTTKDQLCGIVFGLAVAHTVVDVPRVRVRIAEIVAVLTTRLQQTGWSLRDQSGQTGTNAHRVDAPLRLALEALQHATLGRSGDRPSSKFFAMLPLSTAYYNRFITRTFAWNLNAMNAHTLMVLDDHHREGRGVRRWEEKIWRFMATDDNPHFAALHIAWTGEPMPRAAWKNLQMRAAHNYYKFFAWEKDPDQWWHDEQKTEGPGLDVLLPYWTMRHYAR
ncbi:MAG: hypothetical protein GY733_00150 [bacterium]|nr:hypothetical protein [bacterium]